MAAPVRISRKCTLKWYYLGGYFRNGTTDPCWPLYIPPDAWQLYAPEIQFHLSDSYATLLEDGAAPSQAKLLDLSMFTESPRLEYEVWKGSEVVVRNPAAPEHLMGKKISGGFPLNFWTDIASARDMLPKAVATWVDMGVAKVLGGFYQVHSMSVAPLEELVRFLEDSTGAVPKPTAAVRKRIVMAVEFPAGWHDVSRVQAAGPAPEADHSLEDGAPPVYEWWFGDRPQQAACGGSKPRGFWKRYHPKVCQRLEAHWKNNADFTAGRAPADVDGVRYMLQHISEDCPFDYCGREGRGESFTKEDCVTIEYPCYENVDRLTGNCFVQFHKGNPLRRRPARRIVNPEERARNAVRTGEPCSVCFSEDGTMTGCAGGHVICDSCLRMGLRSMAGDILTYDHLLCGCFSHRTKGALLALAERADTAMQAFLAKEPANKFERMELDMELQDTRNQFGLGDDGSIPPELYRTKIQDWFDKVMRMQIAPDYYVCSHPSCAEKVENWMLRTDFDTEYRAKGKCVWICPDGHRNSILPTDEEIRDINKIILLHPEYYKSGPNMRRRRICRGCVQGGVLMLAEHAEACKHWPGDSRSHQHVFCFACTRVWGRECGHGRDGCIDPGVQQVRKMDDHLEIGHVDGPEYIRWLNGEITEPPPTVFECGLVVPGMERQEDLSMVDKNALLKESQAGTGR